MRNWSLDDAVLLLNASRPSIKKIKQQRQSKREAQHILKPVKLTLLWTATAESCYLLVISLSPRSCCQKRRHEALNLTGWLCILISRLICRELPLLKLPAGLIPIYVAVKQLHFLVTLWFILFTNTQPKSTWQRKLGLCLVTKALAFVSVNTEVHCICVGSILGLNLTFS